MEATNPAYEEDGIYEKSGEIVNDIYDGPNEGLKDPLFTNQPKYDKMKIVEIVIQAITLLVAAVIFILAIVILARPMVAEEACTTGALIGDGKAANCSLSPSEAMKVATILNRSSSANADVYDMVLRSFTQLIQLTKNMTQTVNSISSFNDDQQMMNRNFSDLLYNISQAYQGSSLVLYGIVGSLSSIKDTSTSNAGAVNDILLGIEDILELQNKSLLFNYIHPVSCQDIKATYPNISSGYYYINGRNTYCNMDQLCGSGGGWTRVGYFDMNDVTTSCPDGFRLWEGGYVRACGRTTGGHASCAPSQIFPTNGISYTQICGKVIGYQFGTPDAVDTRGNPTQDINSHYLDGVSITRGTPREHVWSLIAGVSDGVYDDGNCPCNNPPGGTQQIRPFMGNNYFCESANPNRYAWSFFFNDALWDGEGCGSMEGPCCAAPGLPWFHRDYGNMSSTDSIELRVCGNQGFGDEDTPIAYYEIYIK